MSCCAHRNILTYLVLSCLVHGDSSGAGGSSCCGHGGHSSRLPPCRGGGSGSCGMSCPVCLWLAPEDSWYPLTSPGKFFVGGKRVPAVGAGPRWPQGPPAMASWAPCTAMASWASSYAMASWAPCTAMASFVCLFRSGGPRPVFLSMSVLRGLQSAHPPSLVELLRRGTCLPGGGSCVRVLLCVSCVPASCVHIWFVSCPCFMSLWVKYVPAVFMWLCVNCLWLSLVY